jgi:hypothetical protein
MDNDSVLIHNVRRQVIIDRHQDVITDMESTISDSFIEGTIQNPRLQAMLRELEEESEQNRIHATIAKLIHTPEHQPQPVQKALVDYICLVRDHHDIGVASLQMHAIGVYRYLQQLIRKQRGWHAQLDDLRAIRITDLNQLGSTPLPEFATAGFVAAMLCPDPMIKRTVSLIRELRDTPQAANWQDDTRPEQVPRDLTDALTDLSESERERKIKAALADRVRHEFYQQVFIHYFATDEFDPEQSRCHPTLLDWLLAIRETPQLFCFMQGQSPEQKNFRLAQLSSKILQVSELYQRVATAADSGHFDGEFAGANTRQRLHVLASAKEPPLTVDEAFITATFQYPLDHFAQWLQYRVATQDFVLPPEHRRR